jgi:hypothetical protein
VLALRTFVDAAQSLALALRGRTLALVRTQLAIVGHLLTIVGDAIPLVGDAISFISDPLAPGDLALAQFRGRPSGFAPGVVWILGGHDLP